MIIVKSNEKYTVSTTGAEIEAIFYFCPQEPEGSMRDKGLELIEQAKEAGLRQSFDFNGENFREDRLSEENAKKQAEEPGKEFLRTLMDAERVKMEELIDKGIFKLGKIVNSGTTEDFTEGREEFDSNEFLRLLHERRGYIIEPAPLIGTQIRRGKKINYEKGKKETDGKLDYELDWNFIEQMAERMAQNKDKYEPYNWQKPMDVEKLKQSLLRHTVKIMKGEYKEDSRELAHLESVAINAMMISYQLRKS